MYYEIKFDMDETDNGECVWLVSVPQFPEITTFGDTKESASKSALAAIEEAMAGRISASESIPVPMAETSGKGYYVEVPLLTLMKIFLYGICREKGVSRAELSRRLSWHREQVDRLFRLDHKSQIDQLEAAFKAVGEPLTNRIDFSSAA
jgi:antitoxin HicB